MTTVQIIGIAVASLVVLLLIVALLVSRRRDRASEEPAKPGSSFLDEAPQDTFAGLGRAEHPIEDVTVDPAVQRAAAADAARTRAENPAPGGLGLDWGPDLSVRTTPSTDLAEGGGPEPQRQDESASPSEHESLDVPDTSSQMPAIDTESGREAAATQPAQPAEGGPAADGVTAQESGSGGRLVPLSDIIVTTSKKMVDLQDADVRRMLTELVTYEIDQAAELRRQGQTIDAVLQLTEAEKVSRALGMNESAERIRAMTIEIQGGRPSR